MKSGEARLVRTIERGDHLDAAALRDAILADVQAFVGGAAARRHDAVGDEGFLRHASTPNLQLPKRVTRSNGVKTRQPATSVRLSARFETRILVGLS